MQPLQSEQVIVQAPLSFTGATKRIWKLTASENESLRYIVLIPSVSLLLAATYALIVCWYAVFGILLIPYRVLRRSQRKQKAENLRHRELLHSISTANQNK